MFRILLLLFIFFPLFSFSQSATKSIDGVVVNPKLEPIPNATITIATSDTDGVVKKFAFTNAEGKFLITVPTVTYPLYLLISFVGYETYNVLVTDSLINTPKQFIITPLTKELPEVHIIADRAITKRGDTTSFKVSAFAKGNESNIADLLKKLPGFHIDETGSMSFNGKQISAVLVEDDDLFGRNYGNLINNASTNGLDKVEVIEHYKNTSRLESSLAGGDQTVVNLKYKKIGLRNFG
ncbi:MAG: carboxypeptidase regulatory-like domain-containing protein, partial [Deinococcales bacterium]|nr:carboxypeptidase regulatory-like domain-containing protein [Chitinophagaceae bacterium]